MVYDALHADEGAAGDAEMTHQLLGVGGTEIGLLHHLLLLVGELKSEIILWQLFSFELLGQSSPADGAEGEPLLFKLDETDLTEGVTAVQITRDAYVSIEVLVAGRTFHSCLFN